MGREYPDLPVVGVGAVVLRPALDGGTFDVLLIKRAHAPSQGEWSLPGGRVELGERLEEAVIREVREETGLEIEPVAQVAVLDHVVRDKAGSRVQFHYVLVDYACRVTSGSLACATDALDACWAAADDLGAFTLRPETLEVIRQAAITFRTTQERD